MSNIINKRIASILSRTGNIVNGYLTIVKEDGTVSNVYVGDLPPGSQVQIERRAIQAGKAKDQRRALMKRLSPVARQIQRESKPIRERQDYVSSKPKVTFDRPLSSISDKILSSIKSNYSKQKALTIAHRARLNALSNKLGKDTFVSIIKKQNTIDKSDIVHVQNPKIQLIPEKHKQAQAFLSKPKKESSIGWQFVKGIGSVFVSPVKGGLKLFYFPNFADTTYKPVIDFGQHKFLDKHLKTKSSLHLDKDVQNFLFVSALAGLGTHARLGKHLVKYIFIPSAIALQTHHTIKQPSPRSFGQLTAVAILPYSSKLVPSNIAYLINKNYPYRAGKLWFFEQLAKINKGNFKGKVDIPSDPIKAEILNYGKLNDGTIGGSRAIEAHGVGLTRYKDTGISRADIDLLWPNYKVVNKHSSRLTSILNKKFGQGRFRHRFAKPHKDVMNAQITDLKSGKHYDLVADTHSFRKIDGFKVLKLEDQILRKGRAVRNPQAEYRTYDPVKDMAKKDFTDLVDILKQRLPFKLNAKSFLKYNRKTKTFNVRYYSPYSKNPKYYAIAFPFTHLYPTTPNFNAYSRGRFYHLSSYSKYPFLRYRPFLKSVYSSQYLPYSSYHTTYPSYPTYPSSKDTPKTTLFLSSPSKTSVFKYPKDKKSLSVSMLSYDVIARHWLPNGTRQDKLVDTGSTLKDAVLLGQHYVDNTPSTSFSIVPSRKKGKKYFGVSKLHKFSKRHGRWYEKNKYRFDRNSEKQHFSMRRLKSSVY